MTDKTKCKHESKFCLCQMDEHANLYRKKGIAIMRVEAIRLKNSVCKNGYVHTWSITMTCTICGMNYEKELESALKGDDEK